jgi:hypothetical protein
MEFPNFMKNLILAALLMFLAAGSYANELDFAKASCAKFDQKISESERNPELQKLVDAMHFWLLGYASAKMGLTTMSGPKATEFALELRVKCRANPSMSVALAAEEALKEVR